MHSQSDFSDLVLKSDLCMPAQKVESVMRQCLNGVFNKKALLRKRTKSEQLFADYSDMQVSEECLALVQVAATEFVCFVTSDAIESVQQAGRVAIKEQDVIESLENLGFTSYLRVLDSQLRHSKK